MEIWIPVLSHGRSCSCFRGSLRVHPAGHYPTAVAWEREMTNRPEGASRHGVIFHLAELSRSIVAAAIGLAFFFPVYFMISSAFKAESEILASPIHWIPHEFQGLNQLYRAQEIAPLGRYFLNSSLLSIINVVVTVFFSALA